MFDTVCASDFKALSEAVKLDLNELGRFSWNNGFRLALTKGGMTSSGVLTSIISSSSSSFLDNRGCSLLQS